MRTNIIRTLGLILAVSLFSPVGFLFSIQSAEAPALTSNSANWADSQRATNMFNQIQTLDLKVQKEVGPLQVEGAELTWQDEGSNLNRIRSDVNQMGSDLLALSGMRKKLEPWQQQLLTRMTPEIHEMVYETGAAIQALNAQHNTTALAATNYPQYIKVLSHQAGKLADSVGTYTQYVQAAQKLATVQRPNAPKAG